MAYGDGSAALSTEAPPSSGATITEVGEVASSSSPAATPVLDVDDNSSGAGSDVNGEDDALASTLTSGLSAIQDAEKPFKCPFGFAPYSISRSATSRSPI